VGGRGQAGLGSGEANSTSQPAADQPDQAIDYSFIQGHYEHRA
jgi:hypothetical protein